MSFSSFLSFDLIVLSLMCTVALREAMILILPDSIAGPEGWLVRTGGDR